MNCGGWGSFTILFFGEINNYINRSCDKITCQLFVMPQKKKNPAIGGVCIINFNSIKKKKCLYVCFLFFFSDLRGRSTGRHRVRLPEKPKESGKHIRTGDAEQRKQVHQRRDRGEVPGLFGQGKPTATGPGPMEEKVDIPRTG